MSRTIKQHQTKLRNPRGYPVRNGTTLVEFAVTSSIAFMFFFASVEFCRVASIKESVELALYEGGRAGIIAGATETDILNEAKRVLAISGISNATIEIIPATITDATDQITIRIQLPLDSGMFGPVMFFSGKSLDRSLSMQREGAHSS